MWTWKWKHPCRSAKQLYWNRTSAWVFSCKFAAYFQNNLEHLWMAASEYYGIDGTGLEWFKAYFSNRKQRISSQDVSINCISTRTTSFPNLRNWPVKSVKPFNRSHVCWWYKFICVQTPCPSVPVASPANKFLEIATLVPNYGSPAK